MEDGTDRVIGICIAAAIGAVLVCSMVIPIVSSMLGTLVPTNEALGPVADQLETWKTLIELVVMMVIVGLVIAVIRGVTNKNR